MKTIKIQGRTVELPADWEVVTEGRVQTGDQLYNVVLDQFEPAKRATMGVGVGSRFCVIRRTGVPEAKPEYDLYGFKKARQAAEILNAFGGADPDALNEFMLAKISLRFEPKYPEGLALSKSDCDAYCTGFSVLNTILKAITGHTIKYTYEPLTDGPPWCTVHAAVEGSKNDVFASSK